MGRIITIYNDLHLATGGYIEENKSKYFSCQWKIRSGHKVIKNIDREVEINHLKLQQINYNKNEKTLGIIMGPSLT